MGASGYDLVPDVTCADFIAVFRKKFCCEFVSDERTANMSSCAKPS